MRFHFGRDECAGRGATEKLCMDIGRARVLALPTEETRRRPDGGAMLPAAGSVRDDTLSTHTRANEA
jgi:hypothetical protein